MHHLYPDSEDVFMTENDARLIGVVELSLRSQKFDPDQIQ